MAGCTGQQTAKPPADAATFPVSSTAFDDGGMIPREYTCDGSDRSPPLAWDSVPGEAVSYALIVEDPDAPFVTFSHWIVYGIPHRTLALEEGIPAQAELPGGIRQGTNGFGRIGYGGPCPPAGAPHRYVFRVYALDIMPDIDGTADRERLLAAMEGHILAAGELTGLYGRNA
ncbi:MAG: YbhB/YbcL family Raf kinase inhibitor-like protein [Methanomicrobiales archaeon]|nr:YbhB/YbcL family Raf kinase inhibitor-like protein [Methanomicrobiales archaeon]